MAVFKFNGFLIGAFVNISVINENDANVIKQQVGACTQMSPFSLILLSPSMFLGLEFLYLFFVRVLLADAVSGQLVAGHLQAQI
jgi:hypothetical protein